MLTVTRTMLIVYAFFQLFGDDLLHRNHFLWRSEEVSTYLFINSMLSSFFKEKKQQKQQQITNSPPKLQSAKGYGLFIILFKSTFSLQYGHVCFLPTMHQPRMQNSWNLLVQDWVKAERATCLQKTHHHHNSESHFDLQVAPWHRWL